MVAPQRGVLWAALIAIILLILWSIYGAFLGAERAQAFFNTLPLVAYWAALVLLLAAGIALFRRLLHVPALLLLHFGSILVLVGAMWGSNGGHALAKRLFGIDKIPQGQMGILEQTQENRVILPDSNGIRELPFFVRLKDFRLDFYRPGILFIRSRTGQNWRMPAEAGQTLYLGEELGTITIRRTFENFKMDLQGDEPVAYDPPGGSNPALEIAVEKPGEPPGRRYVFEQPAGHDNPDDLLMSYSRMVKDYVSELEIVQDDRVVAAKQIEVNHPLYYGGYHFYQESYGQDPVGGEYTVLMVVSDSGLSLVYSGYVLLIAGVFWHFWGRRVLAAVQSRRVAAPRAFAR